MATPINPLPTPPSPADSPVDFNTKAFALLGALPAFVTEANAQASGVDAAVLAAETEADAAALKAGEALTSANNAALSKTGADSARDAAVIAKNAAEAALDSFDDRYLGAKAVAPTTDNDGGALLTGALYWDTSLPGMRSWDGGAWVTLPAATKASVGLEKADNTSDADKPVSAAQAAAFVSKAGDSMTGPLIVENVGTGAADVTARAYGFANDGAVMHGNQARGTKEAPLPPLAGDAVFGIGARPWDGTQWAAHSIGAVHIFAREDISATNQGSSFRIAVTPLGSNWVQRINAVAFECDGVGQGARWRAKFSGAPLDTRTYFQDNTGNATTLGVLSGVDNGGAASLNLFSGTNPLTHRYAQFSNNTVVGVTRLFSGRSPDSALAAYPIQLEVDSGAQLMLETNGAVTSRVGALGYGPGAGGAVTQSTNKGAAVTLNKPSGRITMAGTLMAAGEIASFSCSNSFVSAGDIVVASLDTNSLGASEYAVGAHTSAGTIRFTVHNRSAGALSNAVVINFAVIKGAAS